MNGNEPILSHLSCLLFCKALKNSAGSQKVSKRINFLLKLFFPKNKTFPIKKCSKNKFPKIVFISAIKAV